MHPDSVRWLMSFAAAAALHASAFAWIGTRPTAVAPVALGSEAIELNFEVVAEAATAAQPAVRAHATPTLPGPAPAREPPPKLAPAPTPQPVGREPVAQTAREPAPASAPASAAPVAAEPAPVAAASTAKTRFTGKPARNVRSYFGQISAWIDANKDYPAECKKHKQQGAVVVKFTIGRDGQLLASTIKQSSGHALLDQAALATLARAAPFPPIPDFVGRETLSIAVPIDYALITD